MLPYLEQRGAARQLIVDGRPFLMLAGELHNSSAASAADMALSFPRLRALNFNTVIAPVSWELVEPAEGVFDLSLVDAMLRLARENGLRLVLLWFGSWKNGKSCYAPAWVLSDPGRFPRVETVNGLRTDVLSPFNPALREADGRALAAVMSRIREQDERRHTVLMVQVENEVGILGQPRDFSPAAERLLAGPVPAALTAYLAARQDTLLDSVKTPWMQAGRRERGTWAEVFGPAADEIFMAWHLASNLEAVAAAGRAAYDLPMYANAWLKQARMTLPGQYPSGGPISDMLDIWRAAAPHLDFLAPDIYVDQFKEVCVSYTRSGNPLFIPEARMDNRAAGQALYAFGQHAAMGFGPFACDDLPPDHPLGPTYRTLEQLMDVVTAAQADGRIIGFYQEDELDRSVQRLGPVKVYATQMQPRSATAVPGGGLLIQLEDGAYLAVGHGYWLQFSLPGSESHDIEVLAVEEGTMEKGRFVPLRRLNGDENLHGQGVPLNRPGSVYRFRLNLAAGSVRFRPEWTFPESS